MKHCFHVSRYRLERLSTISISFVLCACSFNYLPSSPSLAVSPSLALHIYYTCQSSLALPIISKRWYVLRADLIFGYIKRGVQGAGTGGLLHSKLLSLAWYDFINSEKLSGPARVRHLTRWEIKESERERERSRFTQVWVSFFVTCHLAVSAGSVINHSQMELFSRAELINGVSASPDSQLTQRMRDRERKSKFSDSNMTPSDCRQS